MESHTLKNQAGAVQSWLKFTKFMLRNPVFHWAAIFATPGMNSVKHFVMPNSSETAQTSPWRQPIADVSQAPRHRAVAGVAAAREAHRGRVLGLRVPGVGALLQ